MAGSGYFEFVCPVKIVSGRKALPNLPYELERLGSSRPFIITDQGVCDAGLMRRLHTVLTEAGVITGEVFDGTPVDSGRKVVNRAAEAYRKGGCDGIIALGGGSVIDTAKGVNIVVSEGVDDIMERRGADNMTAQFRPLIAIPTTSGTGSEVTPVAVILNEDAGVKMAFISARLFPSVAIIDPSMLVSMSPLLTAATGMDAITHAIEGYICLQKNPVSDTFCVSGLRMLRRWIVEAVERGGNEETRLHMATGAMVAGMGFGNSMVGSVHALAHACGGVARVPHGVANSIMLPHVLEYNMRKSARYLAELAPELCDVDTGGLTTGEKAEAAVEAVMRLTAALHERTGIPMRLRDAGVQEGQLEKIAGVSINDGAVTYNPEEMGLDDALMLLRQAF
ncbi:MAG: iron-containing alcohol dehydrogenase [Myxococcota bacterium]|jgi:alcohol dehydrogenase